MNEVIKTENLSKEYVDVKAVSSLNLNVRKGEIYGFLGLNGAGKTTTIRMLLGMIKSNSGKAYINSQKVSAASTNLWDKIGYLVEVPYSYPNLTVFENLELFRRMYMITDKKATVRIIEKLELGSYKNRKAKNLSLGNKQRLGLAKALIHNPEILILDEPTNGLDPAGIYDVRQMLKSLAEEQGVTIFISSHILGEISRIATRIGIIQKGILIEELNTGDLNALCKKQLKIQVDNFENAFSILKNHGYLKCELKEQTILVEDDEALSRPDKITTLLVQNNCPPKQLHIDGEDLEAFFLRTIKDKGGDLS